MATSVKFDATVKRVVSARKPSTDGPIVTTALSLESSVVGAEAMQELVDLQHEDASVRVTITPLQRPLSFGEKTEPKRGKKSTSEKAE